MQAQALIDYDGTDGFELRELPDPEFGDGRIRVRTRAIGINPWEWKVSTGSMRDQMKLELPAVIGSEFAGVVEAAGPGTGFEEGDEVVGFADSGSYAEVVVTMAERVTRIPRGLSFARAVAVPIAVETAKRGIAPLHVDSGETVVVNGGAGGVGTMAVQLLLAAGAKVIATAGPDNQDFLTELGAHPGVYGDGAEAAIRELAPDGVDAVFDVAGHGFLDTAIRLRGGETARIITIADFEAPSKGVEATFRADQRGAVFADELAAVADGRLRAEVARTFAFAELPQALAVSHGGHVRGKLVVTVP